jgi:hypothetical protein
MRARQARRARNARLKPITCSAHLAFLAFLARPCAGNTSRDPTRRTEVGQAPAWQSQDFTARNRLYSRIAMDEQEPLQVVELRISYRYVTAHPWVVQAIGGFLSAYFMEHPGFRVQRHMEELESGSHLWVCEVPPSMKVLRLLRRLKEDIPPCHAQQIATDLPARPRYLIDCPEQPTES